MRGVVGKERPLESPLLITMLKLASAKGHPMGGESLAFGWGEGLAVHAHVAPVLVAK
jgi:hypothetical protein